MDILKIENIFTQEELSVLNEIIIKQNFDVDNNLGRNIIQDIKRDLPIDIIDKFYKISEKFTSKPLSIDHVMCVEYNKKYGEPNLNPHFDRDTNSLIINFQLSANTDWGLGLNEEVYQLKDNSAVLFNGNTEIHWRPHKEFKSGEYVKMIFVRFCNPSNLPDYSHLPDHPSDIFFKKVNAVRENLKKSTI